MELMFDGIYFGKAEIELQLFLKTNIPMIKFLCFKLQTADLTDKHLEKPLFLT